MTSVEKVMMNVDGKFWTSQGEMIKELDELDYVVVSSNYEYVSVIDVQGNDDDSEFVLSLGHGNSRIWVESVQKVA